MSVAREIERPALRDIAAGLNAVLSNEAAAQDMGRRGRAFIASHYSWPHAAAALINEYEAIATDPIRVG